MRALRDWSTALLKGRHPIGKLIIASFTPPVRARRGTHLAPDRLT